MVGGALVVAGGVVGFLVGGVLTVIGVAELGGAGEFAVGTGGLGIGASILAAGSGIGHIGTGAVGMGGGVIIIGQGFTIAFSALCP